MESYGLRLSSSARRTIDRLPERLAWPVLSYVSGPLLANPRRVGATLGPPLTAYRSARVGLYRVIYRIDEEEGVVVVTRIGHRADVYRPG
ncbi:MAG TPA: type II toxin-antitoxin system RelE/ParE family toxin [Coriobacteriia bacterium]